MPDSPDVERTPDGHYLVIDGRRWRASDPGIPDALRQELVDELMAARRAVRTQGDEARPRVNDAKVALGERGRAWWEQPTEDESAERIAATIRALLRKRDGSSICPSDAARVVGGESWRERLDQVRAVAGEMAARGVVVVTKGEEQVTVKAPGPIRLRRGPGFDARSDQGSPHP
ncbi:hypothetical protein BJ980_000289 [Nocardioides daedukensis]|uniref:DUF3253 domain-containing protein n=1 Tax=Nocardioides daedukensis TaxID=634462 RepID=A0A7Y9RVF2_9ACTN|nr:DUF3253 domain-containing protein [Nocardioides daedukensis]NYG57366.1 hypothetical protein [Nocardioides daedukensis]